MDRNRRLDALGLLSLAIPLCALLAWNAPRGEPRTPPQVDPGALAPAHAVLLGWPVRADCPDAEAWEALPGIGPRLATRLAAAAEQGLLHAPPDLLRVDGIGTKMAAALAQRVEFAPAGPPESSR